MRKNRNNNHQRSLLLDDLRTRITRRMSYDSILSFVRVAGVFVLLFCHCDYTCSCRKSNNNNVNNNNGSTVPTSSMSRRRSYSLFPSGGIRRNGNHDDNNNNIFVLSSTQNRKMQYSPKKKKGIDRYDTHGNTKDNYNNNDDDKENENEKKRNSQHTHTHPTKNEKMILKCSLSGGEQDIRIPSYSTTKFYSRSLQPISYFVSDVVPNFLKYQMLEFIHNPMFFQVDSDDSSPSSTSSILTALQKDSTKTKKKKKTKQQTQQKKEFHRVVFNQKMQLILFLLSALVEEDQAFFVNRHRKSIPGHAINFITSRYIDRRKLLVIGAAARALQLCSPM